MLIAIVPLIVAVCGALIYAFASNSKLQEMGRILFFVGVLWAVWAVAGKALKIG